MRPFPHFLERTDEELFEVEIEVEEEELFEVEREEEDEST